MDFTFDTLIVGAGPIGMACAIACSNTGLSYVIIEKGALVNSLFNYPLNMTFFSTAERLEIGSVPFVSTNIKATRPEALEYYRRVCQKFDLNVRLFEEITSIVHEAGYFLVESSKAIYKVRHIIIATGFYDIPNPLGVPGEDLQKVHHYFKESHAYFSRKLVVVGSANSAVDVALESFRKGAQVTMVIRKPAFGDNVKYWVKPDIENRIHEGSIKAYFNSQLIEIKAGSVLIKTGEEIVEIENDLVLAMTGYLPNFNFLASAGIHFQEDGNRTPVYNHQTMETNVAGIYLAGVVCGGYNTRKWFIENSRDHPNLIVAHIQSKKQINVLNHRAG